jgi:hypothetical protein
MAPAREVVVDLREQMRERIERMSQSPFIQWGKPDERLGCVRRSDARPQV